MSRQQKLDGETTTEGERTMATETSTGKTAGPTEPDERTGWRRVDVWHQDVDAGDYAVGDGYSVRYEQVGTPWRAELAYYIEHKPATNQPGEPMQYTVEQRIETWESDETGDDYDAGRDSADYEYDYGDVRYFGTFEQADKIARGLALHDESYAFNPELKR